MSHAVLHTLKSPALIRRQFNQAVRVRSIIIQSSDAARAPKKLKLVINRPSVGFDDLADAEEPSVAQVIELSEADVREGKTIPLRYVRFQGVNSLHVCLSVVSSFTKLTISQILVDSNHGEEDETRIDSIDIFGVSAE